MDEQCREVLESIRQFIYELYGERPTSKQLGDGFTRWCLREIFELADDEAEEAMEIGGSGDNGIDAIFVQEDYTYVIQCKYNRAHSFEAVAGFVETMRQLQNGQVTSSKQLTHEAAAAIQDYGKKVIYCYITNAMLSKTEHSRITHLLRNLPHIEFMDLPKIVDRLRTRSLELPDSFRKRQFKLVAEIDPLEIDGTLTMPVRLADMARFVSETKEFLFHSNIRNYLRRTAINRGIEATLASKPEKFWLYNNGVTIVCEDYLRNGRVILIQTPQVVNGCQTVNTILLFMKGKSQRERDEIPGRVLVRIIRDSSAEERAAITKYTNSQNAVKGKDFLSLDQFQRKLQARFRDLGYYYEIQRGSYAILSRNEKKQYQGSREYEHLTPKRPVLCIPAAEAVQGYVSAFLQTPHIAYNKPSELMPLGERYKDVFNDNTPDDPEYFLIPVLVAAFASQQFGYGYGGEGYRRYGRWFFVSALFSTLLKVMKAIALVKDDADMMTIQAQHLAKIFRNCEASLGLLRLVEEVILDRYFDDYTVRRIVKNDYRNFFKSSCATPQAREILDQKIEDSLNRREGKSMEIAIKRALGLIG